MNPVLDAASTWFFNSMFHSLDGALEVRLVEGIKGTEREYVEVDDTKLGPYFPIAVELTSKCVRVIFPAAHAFFVVDESYERTDPTLKKKHGRTLFEAEASAFRSFAAAGTSLDELVEPAVSEFVLCCEDRIIHVLSSQTPLVHLLDESPDLSVERTQTWATS